MKKTKKEKVEQIVQDFICNLDKTIIGNIVDTYDYFVCENNIMVNTYDEDEQVVAKFFLGNKQTIISSEYYSNDEEFANIYPNTTSIVKMTNSFWREYQQVYR